MNDKEALQHIGQLIDSKCVKKLGEGSFGKTYLFQKGNKKLAVKYILDSKGKNKDFIKKEADILLRLQDSCNKYNILCFESIFNIDNKYFVITEFIDGLDLRDFIDNVITKKISKSLIDPLVTKCIKIIKDLINAVEYIHKIGIIHYDIKPENVMITRTSMKLIDFGAAEIIINGKTNFPSTYTTGYIPQELFKKKKEKTITGVEGKAWDFYSVLKCIYAKEYTSLITTVGYVLSTLKSEYYTDDIEKLAKIMNEIPEEIPLKNCITIKDKIVKLIKN